MEKEVKNHLKHLGVTLDRVISFLYTGEEMEKITDYLASNNDETEDIYAQRSAWVRTSDLAVSDITTEKMALIHLLWLQKGGRIVIEDIDPLSGAVCLHVSFQDVMDHRGEKLADIS